MDEQSNLEIVLPDGTVYKPQKEHTVQGYDPEGKPKKMKFMMKSGCDRCGECCRRDTPIILKEDFHLFTKGVISEKDIYTIREGERIRSCLDGDIYDASMEMIKIRPIFGSFTCLFYDPEIGCTIYEMRPAVCREYECWSQNITITGLEERRLTRQDLFGSIDVLWQAIKKHEEKCSLSKFASARNELLSGKKEAFEKIVDMILYDNAVRDWVKDKLQIQHDLIPLIFGKTLFEMASLYGLIIEKEEENFVIKVMEESI